LFPLLVGGAARLIYLFFFPQRYPESDELSYWQAARSIAEGHGYMLSGQPSVTWMPGMALLLSPVAALFAGALIPMRFFLVAISIATIPLAWRLARAWFGDNIARNSVWVLALFPPFWFFAATLLTETVAIFLVTLALLLLTELAGGFQFRRALGLGLCYGALIYVKPEFVFWGPLLGAAALLWRREVAIRTVAVVGVVGVLMLTPWAVRNWRQFHEFIPLKASAGFLIWWASQDPPVESLDERTPTQIAAEKSFEVPGKPGATGKNAARAGYERIKAHPLEYFRRCFTRRLLHLFVGSQTEAASGVGLARSFADLIAAKERTRLAIKVLLFVMQSLIAALGVLGLAMLGRHIIQALGFGLVVTYMLLLGIPRYSMALMPILIPHGAALASRLRRVRS
jgi:4-amino-4-deoxy-L-arabinose transferase-like glycosyltransferase